MLAPLRKKFRLSLLHEASYEERFSLLLTPLRVIFLLLGLAALVGIVTYAVTALTPLREYIVPGYVDEAHRAEAFRARVLADSLQRELSMQENYLEKLHVILTGGVPADSLREGLAGSSDSQMEGFSLSPEDSLLRAQVEEEDRFVLRVGSAGKVETRSTRGLLFKPLEGSVSSTFDAELGHFGVDLVAPEGSLIKAVSGGVVVLSSFTADGGHVIAVQHDNDLLSIYKHNSALLKTLGENVRVGESIAVIGNTGDHSDGPHLHLELWRRGRPVDPLDYLVFEE